MAPRSRPILQVIADLQSRRAHGRTELERKLRDRGFSEDEIDPALDRAAELLILDPDWETARRAAELLASRPGATPRWVEVKLAARGFSQEIVRRAAGQAFQEWDELDSARKLIAGETNFARAARRLSRRGYAADVIARAIERVKDEDEDADPR